MNKIILFLFVFIIPFSSFSKINFNGKRAIVIDYQDGKILFEKDAYENVVANQFIKIPTYYVLLNIKKEKKIEDHEKVKIKTEILTKTDNKDNTLYLKPEKRIMVKELYDAVAITYANDACNILIDFVSDENKILEEIHTLNKNFGLNMDIKNPCNISVKGQEISLYDSAIIFGKIIKEHPRYYKAFNQRFIDIEEVDLKNKKENIVNYANKNKLIWEMKGADGGVVGNNREGYNIVASVVKDERRYLIGISGMKLVGGREEINLSRARELRKLLNNVLGSYDIKNIYSSDKVFEKIPVEYGKKEFINVYTDKDIYLTHYKNTNPKIELSVKYFDKLIAPIKKGEVVGRVDLIVDNNLVDSYNLITKNRIRAIRIGPARFLANIKTFLGSF